MIIQSYDPTHFAITAAQNHDYLGFSVRRSALRSLGYPPFRHLTRILASGPQQEAKEAVEGIYHFLLQQDSRLRICWEAPALLAASRDVTAGKF